MFLEFLRFELRFRLRQPAVYIFSVIFALLSFGAMSSDAVIIGGGGGQTAINAPFVITQMMGIMSAMAVILVTAFVSTAVTRDFEQGTDALFFTKPVRTRDLLVGRFLGAVLVAGIAMLATALGMMVGTLMPWLDPERLVPFSVLPYVHALGVFMLPNLVIMGALFFSIATLSRRVLPAYVGVVVFFVVYSISESFIGDLDNDTIAALTDPLGLATLEISTRYWTVAERNTSLVPLSGLLWLNRAIWLALAGGVMAFTVRRFSFAVRATKRRREPEAAVEASRTDTPLVVAAPRFGLASTLRMAWVQLRVELGTVLRGKAFLVVVLFGAFNVVGGALGTIDEMFGTPVLPVTHLMVRVIDQSFALFVLIVITFYAGELVHKERQVGLHEVHDALPVPSWVPLGAKLGALVSAVFILLGVAGLTGVVIQLAKGYGHVELPLYAKDLWGLSLSRWVLLCVLAVFFQVLVNHKYLGFFLMVLFFVSQAVLPALDLQHGLYRFAWAPAAPYSDMNGYGHFLRGALWYRLYWSLFAAGLVLVANLLWVRGTDARLPLRLREARRRITGRQTLMLAVVAGGVFALGAVIVHRTTVLNTYRSSDDQEGEMVRYEQAYKADWDGVPQPQVVKVDVDVDIYPHTREFTLRGTITLANPYPEAIETMMVSVDPDLEVVTLGEAGDAVLENDAELGVRILALESPLAPGATRPFPFELRFAEPGFKNHGSDTHIVDNGTFFDSRYMPHFGYSKDAELTDRNERRKRGLPERERARPPSDMDARAHTYLGAEGNWIEFAATVSTSADQIALAPGYLVKQWEQDGRRYFRYEMDAPILNFYAFLSADYAVARDSWNDVAIEVYHHSSHDMNVPRMIDAVKKSLEYYTANFGPYQHRQVRIVEFPRYSSFAQSFPNTIPYSESIGFIADLRDEERIDYVFYVTAHEVAHQWWAHQVIGGDVQGSTMLSESLSQYSALMVMEKEYGRDKMHKFLEYELDRYLRGRGLEREREMPLSLVENQQYIHYAKGSLVFYALRETMGEDALNRVLASYVEDVKFQSPPFTTSLELVERIRAAMPPRFEYLVEDMLETITLYDNRLLKAEASGDGDGFVVELTIESHKLRADGEGSEEELELSDWLPIGVYGEDEDAEPLYLEWHHITDERTELRVEVDERPARAGVDPRVLFIDREPDDNVRSVEWAQ